jgi:hypothetical protein
MDFVGTLMLTGTVGDVQARVYYHEEQKTVFTIVHDANLHALEMELREESHLLGRTPGSLMDYTLLKMRGASLLPSFLRSATEPYYLVREGIAPVLAMRSPDTTKELVGSVLDKGNASVFADKIKGLSTIKFTTVFTKSCAPPLTYPTKLTAHEAKIAADDMVHALVSAIMSCRRKDAPCDVDSEAETSVLTPSPPRWAERPVRHLSVRAFRANIQVTRTLYGARAVADKDICLFTNMIDVGRAMSKSLLSTSDNLLLGRFLSERFRNHAEMITKAEMLQAIAESLDARCSVAFVTLETGGGGALAPPLLLAHAGNVVESTAEHLARLLDGCHTAVIKFSHMENRVRQVAVQGVTRSTLRLSEAFRTSMISSLVHDSKMEVVTRPLMSDASDVPEPPTRAPEGADMDASLHRLDKKRRLVDFEIVVGARHWVESERSQP